VKLHDFNPGSDRPLIHLAHANGFPPSTYVRAVDPLLSEHHVVSLFARPFWGEYSADTLRHWSVFADDLLAGLKEVSSNKVIAIGHSLGGVATLYAAVREPELFSHVILIDPTMLPPAFLRKVWLLKWFGIETRKELVQGALRRRRQWANREEAYQSFKTRPLFKQWPDETLWAYVDGMTAPDEAGGIKLIYPPEWEARIYRTIPTDVWKFAARLTQPTLVIRGETSNTFTADSEKAFRKAKPDASFAVVKEAGHLVPQERPEEVGRRIQEFLNS
jgi:pimeloyl-ACP methyl ester carboxylesterase